MVLSTFGLHQIPKRGGVGQWLPLEEGHDINTCKHNNILILKYFSCFTFGTESRGIVVVVKGGKKWPNMYNIRLRASFPPICYS